MRIGHWAILLTLGILPAACSTVPTFGTLCSEDSGKDYAEAARVLSEREGRLPASATESLYSSVVLNHEDRERWETWSRERLKRVQDYLDYSLNSLPPSTDPRYMELLGARDEMTRMANFLVQFHAYADLGEAHKMLVTLDRIQVTESKIRNLACHDL